MAASSRVEAVSARPNDRHAQGARRCAEVQARTLKGEVIDAETVPDHA